MNARASENYLAISSKIVEIFWAEIYWGRLFLGPNVKKIFFRQYVQPCLLKNPKYTFYTIKSSLKLAYYFQKYFVHFVNILKKPSFSLHESEFVFLNK